MSEAPDTPDEDDAFGLAFRQQLTTTYMLGYAAGYEEAMRDVAEGSA